MKNVWLPVVVVVVLLALLLIGGAFVMSGGMGIGMMGPAGFRSGAVLPRFGLVAGLAMTCLSVIAIAAVIGLVAWLARQTGSGEARVTATNSPLEVLKTRYASGEITKEQYDQMRRDLGG